MCVHGMEWDSWLGSRTRTVLPCDQPMARRVEIDKDGDGSTEWKVRGCGLGFGPFVIAVMGGGGPNTGKSQ